MPRRAPGRAARSAAALLAAVVLLPAVAGCGAPPGEAEPSPIEGTGALQTEIRDVAPFTRVSIAAPLKVIIGAADEQQLAVVAQGNIIGEIETEVVDGQLIVNIPPPGVSAPQPMSITIKGPTLESVALSNGAVGYLEHTGAPVNIDVSGGADLTAIGTTPTLTLSATAGSHAKLGELAAQDAAISLNDGSSATLDVTGVLSGTADGGSTVVLTTKPATNTVELKAGSTIQGG